MSSKHTPMPQQFGVWAPYAHGVRLHLHDSEGPRTLEMQRDETRRDWWVVPREVAQPEVGARYSFSLLRDGEWSQRLPDPRSRFQPEGVHGPSEVTSSAFAWTDDSWEGIPLRDQILYELHVGTFTPQGTFEGVVDKLDYLAELGVNAIELLPVQPFAGHRNWGYDGVDWFAVQESYGGPEGLKTLIDAAHARGIAVILDVVYNHFGPEGNYNGNFGPYTTAGHTGWGDVINLSGAHSDEVRAYVLDAVRQWLNEFHVDGLRLDAVQTYDDRLAFSIMEEIKNVANEAEAATGIPRTIIAESEQNNPRLLESQESGGYGLDAHWLDDVHHGIHTLVTGERAGYYADYGTLEILADTLRNGYRFREDYSVYRQRTHGKALDLDRIAPWQMVTYTTDHDQTGNRAQGDRPSQYLSARKQVLKAAVVVLSPFSPMLFMGEEFGARTPFPFFVSHSDPNLLEMTRQGRMNEFSRMGWNAADVPDPAAEETFTSAKLDWDFDEEQREILAAYKKLIELRRQYPMARDDLRQLAVKHGPAQGADDAWLTMCDQTVLVANFGSKSTVVPVGGPLLYTFGGAEVSANETRLEPWAFALVMPTQ